MRDQPLSAAATRRRALWLFLALLPMLTFAGHWPSQIDIPGTNFYLALPLASHAHVHDSGEDHGRHCHANAASCSDVPAPAGAGFALLSETLALLGAAALMVVVATRVQRAPAGRELSPELKPPRSRFAIA
jgi:hypothetical protein